MDLRLSRSTSCQSLQSLRLIDRLVLTSIGFFPSGSSASMQGHTTLASHDPGHGSMRPLSVQWRSSHTPGLGRFSPSKNASTSCFGGSPSPRPRSCTHQGVVSEA